MDVLMIAKGGGCCPRPGPPAPGPPGPWGAPAGCPGRAPAGAFCCANPVATPANRKAETIRCKIIVVRIALILRMLEAARLCSVRVLGYAAGLTRYVKIDICYAATPIISPVTRSTAERKHDDHAPQGPAGFNNSWCSRDLAVRIPDVQGFSAFHASRFCCAFRGLRLPHAYFRRSAPIPMVCGSDLHARVGICPGDARTAPRFAYGPRSDRESQRLRHG